MTLRRVISIILGLVSGGALFSASAVKDMVDCFKYELPLLIVALVAGIIAIVLYKWVAIRRVTYPALICMWAWLYEHKLAKSEFSRHTYKVYVFFGRSYSKLYDTVQDAFDHCVESDAKVG